MNIRRVTTLLAFGSLAALPACSSMSTPTHSSQSSNTTSTTATPAVMATASMVKPELSPATLKDVQTSLSGMGLYKGPVDGLWGPMTEAAVLSFQKGHGLTASGQIDHPTLNALNVPMDAPATTAAPADMAKPVATAPAATTAPAPATTTQ